MSRGSPVVPVVSTSSSSAEATCVRVRETASATTAGRARSATSVTGGAWRAPAKARGRLERTRSAMIRSRLAPDLPPSTIATIWRPSDLAAVIRLKPESRCSRS